MVRTPITLAIVGGILLGSARISTAQPPPPTPDPQPNASGPEVLTRGPIHEAFAKPIVFNPEAGPVVPKKPPEPIEEMPPDQKPQGNNVVWIGGYWSWDDERKDFLWISGIWRDLPPGRQWVPGYWTPVTEGFQWVSGYWAPTEQEAATYLPQPPAVADAGPNVPAPAPNSIWTPGYWYWYENRYVWRPGYWQAPRPDWIWVPPHYAWTPGGYLFVPGFWDYAMDSRGMVFAPVYFPPAVVVQPAFVYTPSVVIATNVMVGNFFVRPSWGFYYFGDFYGAAYASSGFAFSMSFAFGSSRVAYDPIFTHFAAVNVGWAATVRESYNYRLAHVDARPARTFLAQQARIERGMAHQEIMAQSLSSIAASRAEMMNARASMVGARADMVNARTNLAAMRLEKIDQTQRAEMAQRARSLQQFQTHRLQQESAMVQNRENRVEARTNLATERAEAAATARANHVPTVALPRSPIAAHPVQAHPNLPANPQPGGTNGGLQHLPNATAAAANPAQPGAGLGHASQPQPAAARAPGAQGQPPLLQRAAGSLLGNRPEASRAAAAAAARNRKNEQKR
jgi:hypothetical protein